MLESIKELITELIKDYNERLESIDWSTCLLDYKQKKEYFNIIFKDFYTTIYKDDDVYNIHLNFYRLEEVNNDFIADNLSYERLNDFRELFNDIQLLTEFFKVYAKKSTFNKVILENMKNYDIINMDDVKEWIKE